jgi:hypothetical protein
MESISLLAGMIFLTGKRKLRPYVLLGVYLIITGLIVASIFTWKIFPICFVEGSGLTPFKKYSEYVICAILLLVTALLYRNRARFDTVVFTFMVLSLVYTIISELSFTFYVSNYGFSNLVGHYFKIFSFLCIYKAIVRTGIEDPYKIIFHELDMANQDLTQALDEIKTLKGIIPICMHCKNIRDDQGYWNRIEKFIQEHSDAEFSHSICPKCMAEHYPDIK